MSLLSDKSSASLESVLFPVWSSLFLFGLILSQTLYTDTTFLYVPKWINMQAQDPHVLLLKRISSLSPYLSYRLGALVTKINTGLIPSEDGLLMVSSLLMTGKEEDQGQGLGRSASQQLQLTAQVVNSLEALIQSREGGALSRFAGLFTFSSISIVVGAMGISIALIPALMPLLELIYKTLGPFLLLIHKSMTPFYALFCYALLLYIIVIGGTLSNDSLAPNIIFLAGLVASAVFWGFGSRLNVPQNELTTTMLYSFMLITFAFPAVCYQSQLLGFTATVALFSLLGFVVVPMGCGWATGWYERDAMLVTAVSAGWLSLIIILRKLARIFLEAPALDSFDYFFKPFAVGLSVFGSMTLLLAGLICSSKSYSHINLDYVTANTTYVVALLLYIGLGSILNDDSFRNCGCTFIVLYLSEKVFKARFVNTWVAILCGSAGLVGAGFFFKSNPTFILTLVGVTSTARTADERLQQKGYRRVRGSSLIPNK